MGLFTKTYKKDAFLDSELNSSALPEIILHSKQLGFKPKNFIMLGVYLFLLPTITFSLIVSYLLIHGYQQKPVKIASAATFQAIPEVITSSSYAPEEIEARVEVLTEFFKRYDSPLLTHAEEIIAVADKYDIDWRLVPAIAMQESTLCKRIPKNSHNCWGFGIYGTKVTRFADYSTAIETVTKTLAQEYKEKRGLEEPHEIVTRYTPGSTTWADKVSLVMSRIDEPLQ